MERNYGTTNVVVWDNQRTKGFFERKSRKKGCQILGPRKRSGRYGKLICSFVMKQGESPMISTSIGDGKFLIQGIASKYYA
jgi:ribosomal protein L34